MSDRAERKAGRPARRAPDPAPTAAEPEAAGTPAAPTDDGPTPLRVAVLALWVEAVLVAVLAAGNVVGLVSGDADRADTGIGIVLLLAMAAAALWYAGRLLVRCRPTPCRTPPVRRPAAG